jgi:hypothetical protein
MARWETHRCACAFAKDVDDKNPYHFPRVGMADNMSDAEYEAILDPGHRLIFGVVIYRGHWIIRHTGTGRQSTIIRPGAGTLHAEADSCCFDWFDSTLPRPAPKGGSHEC